MLGAAGKLEVSQATAEDEDKGPSPWVEFPLQGPLRCPWSRVGSLQSLGQVGRRKGQAEGHYQQPCPLFYPPKHLYL